MGTMRNIVFLLAALMVALTAPAVAADEPNTVQKFAIKADIAADSDLLGTVTYNLRNFDDEASCAEYVKTDDDFHAAAQKLLVALTQANPKVTGIKIRCEAQDGE